MSTSTPPFFKDYEPAPSTSPPGAPGRDHRALVIVALLIGLLAVAATVLVVVLVRDSGSPSVGGLAPPPSVYEQAYGTFEPVERSGTGNTRIELPGGATAGIVTAQADGPGWFDLAFTNESGRPTAAWPEISWNGLPTPYSGILVYGLDLAGGTPRWLDVTTDGPWSVRIEPIPAAEELPADASGTGDVVYVYNGDAATWIVRVHTRHEFSIRQWRVGSTTGLSLVSGKGGYRGKVASLDGPSVVAIQTDGRWHITR